MKEAGRVFPQIKLTHVKKLPLMIADEDRQRKIGELVKEVLGAKRREPEAETSATELKIDALIYEIYGVNNTRGEPPPLEESVVKGPSTDAI